jgi:hypothetical protein
MFFRRCENKGRGREERLSNGACIMSVQHSTIREGP